MTEKALSKNRVMLLYLVKAIQDKAKGFIADTKDALIPEADAEKSETIEIEQDGLKVKFVPTASPKRFDAAKAEDYLKDKLGPKTFSQNFAHFKIEQKAGKQPPKELIDEMRKYFTIEKVEQVTEDKIKNLPLGIPKDELEEGCYTRSGKYFKMTTPTKISDKELLERFQQKSIPLMEVLQIEEK